MRLPDAGKGPIKMTEPREVIEFELSKELKTKLRGVFYDTDSNSLSVYIKPESLSSDPKSIRYNVDKSSMRNTLEQFDEIDGTLDTKTKLLCIYSIKYHLIKYVNFDDNEQKWYSETFPNDPSLEHKKEQNDTKNKDDYKEEGETKRKKIAINKYSGNGRLSLHESVVIADVSKFVTLKNTGKIYFTFSDTIETSTDILIPKGTIDTQTPLPYIFSSENEFSTYLRLAISENLDSLYSKVELVIKKYVNVEEHYYPLLAGDIIWTYFQDKFPYTHYLIFTGDNGSGKNSALLVFRLLGYRVFYVVSASAANYYTAMGSKEEGQVTIAEDEAEDIGENTDKRNILKAGYCSGASVPKIELEGGRSQDNWLVYGHRWLALEEFIEDRNTKGIADRSFKLAFVTGDVDYNIKDVIRTAGDPEYQPLLDELIDLRKRLFCYRLLHYKDPILNVKLNVKGRSAELTNPLIRLFRNSPIALNRLLDTLSKFIEERNESKKGTFESKLYDVISSLIEEKGPTEEDKILDTYTLVSESVRERLIKDVEAKPMPDKVGIWYSQDIGPFSQRKINSVLKSKFKAKFVREYINNQTVRCVEFKEEYVERIKSYYIVNDTIKILDEDLRTQRTQRTPGESIQTDLKTSDEHEKEVKNGSEHPSQASEASEASETKPRVQTTCPKCGEEGEPYWMKIHHCDGTD